MEFSLFYSITVVNGGDGENVEEIHSAGKTAGIELAGSCQGILSQWKVGFDP